MKKSNIALLSFGFIILSLAEFINVRFITAFSFYLLGWVLLAIILFVSNTHLQFSISDLLGLSLQLIAVSLAYPSLKTVFQNMLYVPVLFSIYCLVFCKMLEVFKVSVQKKILCLNIFLLCALMIGLSGIGLLMQIVFQQSFTNLVPYLAVITLLLVPHLSRCVLLAKVHHHKYQLMAN